MVCEICLCSEAVFCMCVLLGQVVADPLLRQCPDIVPPSALQAASCELRLTVLVMHVIPL